MLERSETPGLNGPSGRSIRPPSGEQGDTAAAWERFAAGQEVGEGVRPEILLSWYRCRDDFRVDPLQTRAPSAADDWPARSLEDDVVVAELGGVAKSIESDAEAIDGLVAVTDGRGRILAAWGDRQTLQLADESNLAARCTWSEDMAGTNGMGTAIASTGPVFVKGWEHWSAGFHEWSSAGTAIPRSRHEPSPRSPGRVHSKEASAGLRPGLAEKGRTQGRGRASRPCPSFILRPRHGLPGAGADGSRTAGRGRQRRASPLGQRGGSAVLPHRPARSAPRAGTRASSAEGSVEQGGGAGPSGPTVGGGGAAVRADGGNGPDGFVPAGGEGSSGSSVCC